MGQHIASKQVHFKLGKCMKFSFCILVWFAASTLGPPCNIQLDAAHMIFRLYIEIQKETFFTSLIWIASHNLRQIMGKLKNQTLGHQTSMYQYYKANPWWSNLTFWAGKCYVFVRRSANVNLTQLDQNDLPRILLKAIIWGSRKRFYTGWWP